MLASDPDSGEEKERRSLSMDEETPHIEVRAVRVSDAPALHELDYNFETDRIYTLRMHNRLLQGEGEPSAREKLVFAFELVETPVDRPLYKDYSGGHTVEDMEARLRSVE